MAEWNDERIEKGSAQDTRREWVHGLLLPIDVKYFRWKQAGEEKATEISEAEFDALADNGTGGKVGGGERIDFAIEPKHINPGMQYTSNYSVFRGFGDWLGVTQPSINEVTGMKPPESSKEFKRRAATGKWYVEAEIISTKQKKDPSKVNKAPKFMRMTTDLEQAISWAKERYGAKNQSQTSKVVPQDLQDNAAIAWVRIAKRNPEAFAKLLDQEADLKPYTQQLTEMAAAGTLG